MERFVVGDPLRALAALALLGFHVVAAGPVVAGFGSTEAAQAVLTEPVLRLASRLHVGLMLFFVLSGFLISRPFVRAFVEARPMPPVGRYLRNRAMRIVPMFWFVGAVLLLALWIFDKNIGLPTDLPDPSAFQAATVLAFMQNLSAPNSLGYGIGLSWTLHVEVVFYALVPLIAYVVGASSAVPSPQGRAIVVAGLATLLYVCSLTVAAWLGTDPPRGMWFPATAYAFMPGVALAAIEPFVGQREGECHPRRRLLPGALLAFAAAAMTYLIVTDGGPLGLRLLLENGAAALFVAAALVKQWSGGGTWRALDNRALHWLGQRSYSIYLLSGPALASAGALVWGGPRYRMAELLVLTVVIAVALSAFTYRWVERPFLRRHVPTGPAVSNAGGRRWSTAPVRSWGYVRQR